MMTQRVTQKVERRRQVAFHQRKRVAQLRVVWKWIGRWALRMWSQTRFWVWTTEILWSSIRPIIKSPPAAKAPSLLWKNQYHIISYIISNRHRRNKSSKCMKSIWPNCWKRIGLHRLVIWLSRWALVHRARQVQATRPIIPAAEVAARAAIRRAIINCLRHQRRHQSPPSSRNGTARRIHSPIWDNRKYDGMLPSMPNRHQAQWI